jgi:hypothetical protein
MVELSFISQISLYVIVGLIGLLAIVLFIWQIGVLRGRELPNPDGTVDSYREQKTLYGVAVADIFISCPASLLACVLMFVSPRWGHYLLAIVSFWFIWVNTATTVTSLRFARPKVTLMWFIVFPFGILVGLAYLVWAVLNFDSIQGL